MDDLDAFAAMLTDRGIAFDPIEMMGNGVRFTIAADPDGNRLKVAQTQ